MDNDQQLANLLEHNETASWERFGKILRDYARKNDKPLAAIIYLDADGIWDKIETTSFVNKDNIESLKEFSEKLWDDTLKVDKQDDMC